MRERTFLCRSLRGVISQKAASKRSAVGRWVVLAAIALTIQDLSTRVSSLEGVDDIGYAVTPLSELEALFDSHSDIEMTAESEDINSDITLIAQPLFAS